MAKKITIDAIIKLYSKLGGNLSDVLGTRSNVSFMGTGKSSEPFLDMDLNIEALGAISKSKALQELKSPVGFATAEKLNDVQANKLLTNMMKMDEFYNPPEFVSQEAALKGGANITDLATGTRDLTQEGLGALRKGGFDDIDPNSEIAASLRLEEKGKKLADSMSDAEIEIRGRFPKASDVEIKKMLDKPSKEIMDILDAEGIDLPPPGSRGGPDDIAAPVEQGFEGFARTIRELAKSDPELAAQYRTVMTNKGGNPAKRGTAREFLVEALKKENPNQTNLSDIIEEIDVKYITEGGGGIAGDPLALVNKYFGPKILEALPSGASSEEIAIFTQRVLNNVVDANGLRPTDPRFDRLTARFIEEMADGGRAGFFAGGIGRLGKAGYQALRKYGIEAEDITRLFKSLAVDKTLQGKEKTMYFKQLNQVLKNPDDFPDGIKEIQLRLGLDPIGFKSGGLAGILEV